MARCPASLLALTLRATSIARIRSADPLEAPSMPTLLSRALTALATLLLLTCLGIPGVSAQDAALQGPPLEAYRLPAGAEIDLDGRLDEAVWANAIPITDFLARLPVEGAAPSRRTEIRVVFDDDALYIGAKLFDDPDSVIAYQKRRDVSLGTDDRFMWVFDTFDDDRTGYFFETNANGLIGDGIITGSAGSSINKSWNTIWNVKTERLSDGWSVEVWMPFMSLNFDPQQTTWGINFQRTIRRRNEEIMWRGWRRNQSLFNPAFAGELLGLEGLSQGVGLEVRPYATGRYRNQPGDDEPTTWPNDVGLDVGYSLTSGLRAAVSVNTDFAEVEVDRRQVNLTRFPIRFPEQRDFFLEGSGVYSFAPRSGPQPFFSRRIGLEGGQAIPIEYGARLGGQAGRFELGFQQVGTAETEDAASEQFTVARAKYLFGQQSTIGALWTRRGTGTLGSDPQRDDRHTFGVDLDYRTTTFLGDRNLELEAFLAWNTDPLGGLRAPDEAKPDFNARSSRGFRVNYPNDVWQGHLSFRQFGDDYSPAVGFVRRNNFSRIEPRFGWYPRPESFESIRQFQFDVLFRNLNDLETGDLLETFWEFGVFGIEFESGDEFDIEVTRLYEFLDRDFTVGREEIPILQGDYTNWGFDLEFQSARQRTFSVRGNVGTEGFWDGDRRYASSTLSWRPRPGYEFGVNVQRNMIELPRGSFDTNVLRFDGAWDVSPVASITGNLQYDDQSELLGLFFLGRWLVNPGSEIFLVYTHNWQRPEANLLDGERFGFETLSRGGAFKVNYTWRW